LELVQQRDDLSVELCALYNQTGQHERALRCVSNRQFQPWEGGEGGPLGQHVRAQLALGREAMNAGNFVQARQHFEQALTSPRNLSEAKHLLANQSDIHYWLGCALSDLGEKSQAREHWRIAAEFKGDFQEMSVRQFSGMTYYSALAWERLGQRARAKKLFSELLKYAQETEQAPAKIDYFATSLPTMLLFEDDLQFRQQTTALFLQAQAQLGLGEKSKAQSLLQQVLHRDPNHALARDLWNQLAPKNDAETISSRKRLRIISAKVASDGATEINGKLSQPVTNAPSVGKPANPIPMRIDGIARLTSSANGDGI
jgi:tetratricopeptide (TPR) repeat protein